MRAERVLAPSRSRGLAPPPERGQPALVRLSVYDARECPRHPFVLSGPSGEEERLHCGVEVHSCEWSYGGEQRQWGFVRRLAAELAGGLGCSLGCCSTGLCSSRAAGPGTGQELFVVRRQLEQATLQLQQAQRDLACERASHEDAIRQVLQLKRAGSRCPARVPGPLSAKP
uniref:Uncharacterized protein n=1 Tax=Alexandrium catenella TaxID=2925 RepID=A0A7S1R9K3_ALECA